MYSPEEPPRYRWAYPHDNERNHVAAIFHFLSVLLTTTALFKMSWFRIWGSSCSPYLGLYQFMRLGYFEATGPTSALDLPGSEFIKTPVVVYHTGTEVLHCVTPEVLNLMRVLIMLCILCIFYSMVGFCLDVIGPSKKSLRFIRRNALPSIWSVLTVVSIVGVSYLVTRSLEISIRSMYPHEPVHITYEYGCYVVTAAVHAVGQIPDRRRDICQAPFLVALLPLNDGIEVDKVIEFLKGADPNADIITTPMGYVHISSPRLKQKFTLATIKGDNLFDKLDLLKVCNSLVLLTSVEGIDDDGKIALSAIMSQGLPAVSVVVTDIATLLPKKWQDGKNQIENELNKWLPDIDKVLTMDKTGDGLNILRKVALQKQRPVIMRDRRPHLLGESVHFIETDVGVGTLQVTGYLRGVPLSVNSLVHIPGWGDFQLSKIEKNPRPFSNDEGTTVEIADPSKQASLESEAPVDPMDAEQTWPTAEELAEAAKGSQPRKVKVVPKGMSEYQAAWIPDDDAVELSEEDDDEDDEMNVDGASDDESKEEMDDDEMDDAATETSEVPANPDKYDREMNLAEEEAALNQLKQEKKDRSKEDAMFPDEMDTPRDIPARTRFLKYRGLKSFRTTPWDPKENLPRDYARIFQFANFKRMKSIVLAEEKTGPQPGSYVTIHIEKVPTVLNALKGSQPIVVYGLLSHEQKMSVLNIFLKSTPEMQEEVESRKEELLFQVGYRRFKASPIFSTPSTKGNKHKELCRCLPLPATFCRTHPLQSRPGRTAKDWSRTSRAWKRFPLGCGACRLPLPTRLKL